MPLCNLCAVERRIDFHSREDFPFRAREEDSRNFCESDMTLRLVLVTPVSWDPSSLAANSCGALCTSTRTR